MVTSEFLDRGQRRQRQKKCPEAKKRKKRKKTQPSIPQLFSLAARVLMNIVVGDAGVQRCNLIPGQVRQWKTSRTTFSRQ
jgi:hypothetical protein